MIQPALPTTTNMEVPYGMNEEDLELALLIRQSFRIRDLVKIWYNEGDNQYAVQGGLYVMGLQNIYIKGFSTNGIVCTSIIPVRKIVDIQPWSEQTNPYAVEYAAEIRAAMWEANGGHSYEEATLEALRAAGEIADAEARESQAARIREVSEDSWDESFGQISAGLGADQAEAEEEFEKDYIVECGRCEAQFMNIRAYWNHLDEHDMATLNSGKYSQ